VLEKKLYDHIQAPLLQIKHLTRHLNQYPPERSLRTHQ
jgi:hypothetical protein